MKGGPQKDNSKAKIIAVMALFGLIWAGLWARAGYLQLVRGPQLAKLALRQHLAAEFEKGARGRILDREGRVLATSVECKSVYVRPLEVDDPSRAAVVLSKILKIKASRIRKRMASKGNFVWIKRQIGDRAAVRITRADLKGVYLATEYTRLYPNGRLAGQLLGFVGVDGKGLEGIERSFEDVLKGSKAQFVVQKDASGRKLYLDAQGREVDIDGHDVKLTIDANIQQITEDALASAVQKFHGTTGVAVVVEVATGDVVALANYPFFNPNVFRKCEPGDWRDRASLDVVEPGSTMKPFVFAAALEKGAITPETMIDCEKGRWRVSGHTIKDTHPRSWLPADKVLRYSSNIGSAKIGMDLGAGVYHGYLDKLGFGKRTGLPLSGESPGLMRHPKKWRELDLAAASFGQGIGVTSLQLAQGYLSIADGGIMRPLRLVESPEVETRKPERIFSEKTAAQVMSMLTDVVETDGTGTRARIAGLATAGKTGTAQKASKKGGYGDTYVSSFVHVVPAKDPRFVIAVLVDEPTKENYGGLVAAPAARDIALGALAYLGELPETGMAQAEEAVKAAPVNVTRAQATPPPAQAGRAVPDVRGLPVRRAVEVLVTKGVVPVVKGDGMVVLKQKPAPGKPWPKGASDDVFILWLTKGQG